MSAVSRRIEALALEYALLEETIEHAETERSKLHAQLLSLLGSQYIFESDAVSLNVAPGTTRKEWDDAELRNQANRLGVTLPTKIDTSVTALRQSFKDQYDAVLAWCAVTKSGPRKINIRRKKESGISLL